jgi:hypothetical protein
MFLATAVQSRAKIIDFHATSTGIVYDAAVKDVSTDSASVRLILNQKVVNTGLDAPNVERDRIRVSLVRTGGHWLVSKLQNLGVNTTSSRGAGGEGWPVEAARRVPCEDSSGSSSSRRVSPCRRRWSEALIHEGRSPSTPAPVATAPAPTSTKR